MNFQAFIMDYDDDGICAGMQRLKHNSIDNEVIDNCS